MQNELIIVSEYCRKCHIERRLSTYYRKVA